MFFIVVVKPGWLSVPRNIQGTEPNELCQSQTNERMGTVRSKSPPTQEVCAKTANKKSGNANERELQRDSKAERAKRDKQREP